MFHSIYNLNNNYTTHDLKTSIFLGNSGQIIGQFQMIPIKIDIDYN